jgi:hypothetical protein
VTVLWLGLALTGVMTGVLSLVWGRDAVFPALVFGLLGTAIQLAASALVRPVLEAPVRDLLRRWAYGMALRLGGVILFAVAVAVKGDVFLPLPTAIGFLGVLLPLLFMEIRLFR